MNHLRYKVIFGRAGLSRKSNNHGGEGGAETEFWCDFRNKSSEWMME